MLYKNRKSKSVYDVLKIFLRSESIINKLVQYIISKAVRLKYFWDGIFHKAGLPPLIWRGGGQHEIELAKAIIWFLKCSSENYSSTLLSYEEKLSREWWTGPWEINRYYIIRLEYKPRFTEPIVHQLYDGNHLKIIGLETSLQSEG